MANLLQINLYLYIIFIFSHCHTCDAVERCEISHCNNVGECTLVNGEPTCDCINKKSWRGPKCTEIVDNCEPNPCKNGGQCISALGQVLCDNCAPNFMGQHCQIQGNNGVSKFFIHYNPLGYYGEEQIFLFIIDKLGSISFFMDLRTDDYIIDGFNTDFTRPETIEWQKSNSLDDVAKNLKLHHWDKLPFNRGYYHIARAHFWYVADHELLYMCHNMVETIANALLKVRIMLPSNLPCAPRLEFTHCRVKDLFLFVNVDKHNTIDLIVKNRCASNSTIIFHWWAMEPRGNEEVEFFGRTRTPLLKIPPYSPFYSHQSELIQSHLIRVEAHETFGDQCIKTVDRCYVFAMTKPVLAKLIGGSDRVVHYLEDFSIDATQSIDYARAPDVNQELKFSWRCESITDPNNRFCKNINSHDAILFVSKGALKLNETYEFWLLARSTINIYSTHEVYQRVSVSRDKPYLADIECIRNCIYKKFTAQKVIHLKANCLDCSKKFENKIIYKWMLGTNVVSNSERLLYTPTGEESLKFIVDIELNDRKGSSTMRLLLNSPPMNGKCKITPQNGIEYETEFEIECNDYADEDLPILYQIYGDSIVLDRTTNPIVHVRLPKINEVKVLICDFMLACTEEKIGVQLSPLNVPQNIEELKIFLKQNNTNLEKFLKDGEIERAEILAATLIMNNNTPEGAMCVLEQMQEFTLDTLLEVEQLTELAELLLTPLRPLDHNKALLFSNLFQKISYGLENVIRDGEMTDLLPNTYENVVNDFANMLAQFSIEVEHFPEVHESRTNKTDFTDYVKESYASFPDFDTTTLEKIENWLAVSRELHKCIRLVGVAATNMHEPNETRFTVEKTGLKMEVFSIEGVKDRQIETQDNRVIVHMNTHLLTEMQKNFNSEQFLLQVVTMETNPFWWYPIDQRLNTGIFYFTAFNQNNVTEKYVHLNEPIEFTMKVMARRTNYSISGSVESSLEMTVFEIIMNRAVLKVTFLNTNANLCAMLSVNKRPRSKDVRKCKVAINVNSENVTLLIDNDQWHATVAYLAILKPNEEAAIANFTFVLQMIECLSWNFHLPEPEWRTDGCMPTVRSTSDNEMTCRCYHLSTFGGRIYDITTEHMVENIKLLEFIPVNIDMIFFYTFLFIGFLGILYLARKKLEKNREHLILDFNDRDINRSHDIVVFISTGSRWAATTSANVNLSIYTKYGIRRFQIYQNPDDPMLVQNSTCFLKLPMNSEEFTDPLTIEISHDASGRYPRWFCREIIVKDTKANKSYLFHFNRWIQSDTVQLQASDGRGQTRYDNFKRKFHQLLISWFQFQALYGPWRYDDNGPTLFERTCIWICKVITTFFIVACFFGRTTIDNYEEESDYYYKLKLHWEQFLLLFIICFIVSLFVEWIFFRFINKMNNK